MAAGVGRADWGGGGGVLAHGPPILVKIGTYWQQVWGGQIGGGGGGASSWSPHSGKDRNLLAAGVGRADWGGGVLAHGPPILVKIGTYWQQVWGGQMGGGASSWSPHSGKDRNLLAAGVGRTDWGGGLAHGPPILVKIGTYWQQVWGGQIGGGGLLAHGPPPQFS